ncbi:MAG: DedA family protein [Phycisphaerales bacterium]|jgi:membrane protein DedA with SNARE-associated domain
MTTLRLSLGALLAFVLMTWSPASAVQDPTATPTAQATSSDAASSKENAAPAMPAWIREGIEKYGAIAIFVAFIVSGIGLHLSEDFILIPAGWMAAQDWALFGEFAAAAYLGIVLGDAGWFWMCRTFGTRVMHTRWFKRVFHPRRLLEIKWQIDERGAWVLLAARFIPGTRTPVITMCGLLHMAWWKLLLVEGVCVLITAPLQMMIGWLAFHAAEKAGVTDTFHQVMVAVAVTLAVVIGLWIVHKWLDARKARQRPKRASVRWLRVFAVQTHVRTLPS